MRKGQRICNTLSKRIQFPWHGVVGLSDNSSALVFPFLRATRELMQHNEELQRRRKILARDLWVQSHFQDRWHRVTYVISKLAAQEATITESEPNFEWIAAHNEFPLWLDLFYFYVPLLLDSTVIALGLLVSEAPRSFPQQFKTLFKEGSRLNSADLRIDPEGLENAISSHRDWYEQVRPKESKSIRDSIAHRLSKWQVSSFSPFSNPTKKSLQANLQGTSTDISEKDGLTAAVSIMNGYFSFLSSLPSEIWIGQSFETGDLVLSNNADSLGARFLPRLKEALVLEGVNEET